MSITIPIYPGSSSFVSGSSTPFGFYDSDIQFQLDADKVTTFCSRRLGYPIMNIELQDKNFYAAFEEAVTTYGNELYAYKIKQDYLSLEGAPTGSSLNNVLITPNYGGIVRLSQQYGEEAGVGGNVTYYKGAIPITGSLQDYDLKNWALSQSISGGIEVKRIFYTANPSIFPYFNYWDYGIGSPMGNVIINDLYLLTPLSYNLQQLQAVEMNSQIRLSNFSFELKNNNLRIFPIPLNSGSLFFEYIKLNDRNDPFSGSSGINLVNNVSNVPYNNPIYSQINAVGRSWIFEYTLALVKEILGYVRGKYSQVPIPGSEATLNQQDLLTSATTDKKNLRDQLRAYLEETSRTKMLERAAQEAEFKSKTDNQIPLPIYIG